MLHPEGKILQLTSEYADNDSALAEIFKQCKDKTPEERAKYLETCQEIETAHTGAAQVGQTQV